MVGLLTVGMLRCPLLISSECHLFVLFCIVLFCIVFVILFLGVVKRISCHLCLCLVLCLDQFFWILLYLSSHRSIQ